MFIINPFLLASPLPANGVAWYKAENNTNDEGGLYNATAGAGTAYATGYDGVHYAFEFTANSNQQVVTPTINLGTSYTIDFWVYLTTTDANYRVLIANDKTTASAFGSLRYTSAAPARLEYVFNNSVVVSTPQVLNANQWYKITLTYSGSKSKLYINNVLMATESGTHSETYNNTVGFGYAIAHSDVAAHCRIDEILLSNAVVDPTPSGNLIAHYKGENNTDDFLGFWNATAGVGTAYNTGNSGNAFEFNGNSNSALTLPILPVGSAYSVVFDIYIASGNSGYRDLFGWSYAGSSSDIGVLYLNGGKLEYWHSNSKRCQGVASLSTSTWYNIKLTYNPSDSKSRIYINGSLDVTESGTHTEAWGSNRPKIGYSGTSATAAFFGRIDDFKIYNAVV